ncbi:hypothetical protein IF2G_07332 [Cordyceps javanica]|nr:hypothetical protein IF2G_07332 [Cordyceps javanica]
MLKHLSAHSGRPRFGGSFANTVSPAQVLLNGTWCHHHTPAVTLASELLTTEYEWGRHWDLDDLSPLLSPAARLGWQESGRNFLWALLAGPAQVAGHRFTPSLLCVATTTIRSAYSVLLSRSCRTKRCGKGG